MSWVYSYQLEEFNYIGFQKIKAIRPVRFSKPDRSFRPKYLSETLYKIASVETHQLPHKHK
jgi:hypothetical protein